MLTQNSSQNLDNTDTPSALLKEQAQFESLRALYYLAQNASAQATQSFTARKPQETFSSFIEQPQVFQTNHQTPEKNTKFILEARPNSIYTTGEIIEKVRSTRPVEQQEFNFPIYEVQAPKQPTTQITAKSEPVPAQPSIPQSVPSADLAIEDMQDDTILDSLLKEEFSLDLPPHQESWLVRILSRPRLVIGVMGMCVLASSVYAGLGYWWLVSTTNVSNAAEPVNMMQVQESMPSPGTRPALNNIDALQAQPPIVVPKENDSKEETLLAQATEPAKVATLPEAKELIATKEREPDLTGRPDPFAPLIQTNTPTGSDPEKDAPPPKKDVVEDMQYTGFVGNINSKNKLAIIKVVDSTSGSTQTLIKKVGASFYVAGEKVVLKGISKKALHLYVAGENRQLTLSPYQAVTTAVSAPSAATGNAPTAAGATGNAAPGGTSTPPSGGSTSGAFGNLGALSSGNGNNPTNPQLMEPER